MTTTTTTKTTAAKTSTKAKTAKVKTAKDRLVIKLTSGSRKMNIVRNGLAVSVSVLIDGVRHRSATTRHLDIKAAKTAHDATVKMAVENGWTRKSALVSITDLISMAK